MTSSGPPVEATGGHWSVDLLAEYFAVVSLPTSEADALKLAVERAVEHLECEFGAVVIDGDIRASVGLGRRSAGLELPTAPGQCSLVLPGLGPVGAVSALMSGPRTADTSVEGSLILARVEGTFAPEEEQVTRAMATVVGLVLRNLRMLRAEQGRQQLLRELLEVQRSIARRRPLQEVLDAVMTATSTLLDGASATLLLAGEAGGPLTTVAHTAGEVGETDLLADPAVAMRAGARAIERGELVGPDDAEADPVEGGPVAIPVHVHGAGAGALVAWKPGWADHWHRSSDMLSLFAQQVSLALTDADTMQRLHQALHDTLTGLPDRGVFRDSLDHACSLAERRGEPVSVMFLDLDGFKLVNDTYGHAVGDAVLVEVTRRLKTLLRECDTAGRLGGDEFGVVLEGVDADAAVAPARRMIAGICEPMTLSGQDVRIGVSIGIAGHREGPVDADELLKAADASMYVAKRSGSGRIAVRGELVGSE